MEVMNNFLKLVELERAGGSGPGIGAEAVKQNVHAMLMSLPFTVGQRSGHVDAAPLDLYDDLAAELRYEEVMAASAGQEVPARDMLEVLAFPTPNGTDHGG
jgi:hypothetical protein